MKNIEDMDVSELNTLIDTVTKRRDSLLLENRTQAAEESSKKHGPCECGDYKQVANGPFKLTVPYWQEHPNGDLTCSHCGSWHPDQMLAFCKTVDGVERCVDGTTKSYKVYVRKPGGGALKFYTWHHPAERHEEFIEAIRTALKVTYEARTQPAS